MAGAGTAMVLAGCCPQHLLMPDRVRPPAVLVGTWKGELVSPLAPKLTQNDARRVFYDGGPITICIKPNGTVTVQDPPLLPSLTRQCLFTGHHVSLIGSIWFKTGLIKVGIEALDISADGETMHICWTDYTLKKQRT